MAETNWQRAGRRAFYTRLRRKGLGDWHAKEIAGLLEKKQPERERIFTFLTDHIDTVSPHLLTLPGSQFALERMVSEAFPGATFTCLERDTKVVKIAFDHYSKNAPGRGKLKADPTYCTIYTNGTTRLVVDDASQIGSYAFGSPFDCGWYDGMGLLNADDFLAFIRGLRCHLPAEGSIPFVFTLQIGRDSNAFYNKIPGDSLSKRVRKLRTLLREAGIGCEVQEFWSYDSDTNGPLRMMNVCCHLSRHTIARKSAWDIVTFEQFKTLRDGIGAHKLARMLSTTGKTVADWSEEHVADEVAQIELLELVEVGYKAGRIDTTPVPEEEHAVPRRVEGRPTVDDLTNIITAKGGVFSDVAEHYGVSVRTIYDWRKRYGLL